ncbi:carbohydrate binding domain-containing protein [candidate division KSB1 bacterium]|nr:carbohydrate binding domain-containing protein [candidate division KSB1 bacterium]
MQQKSLQKLGLLTSVFLVSFLVTLVTIPTVFAQNLIANGEFDNGQTGWEGWINTGSVSVTTTIDTNSVLSGKNSYKIDITNSSTTSYFIQRNTAAPLQFGKSYKAGFMAVASRADVRINVLFEQAGSPYDKYLNEWAVVGTEPQTFEFTLDWSNVTEPTNQLKLHFGGTDSTSNDSATVWIDAVYVIEEAGTYPVPENNLIQNPEMDLGQANWEGWINTGSVTVATSIDTNGVLSGKNSYMLDITTGSNVSYYIQRNTTCPLQFGKTYHVSFLAVADTNDVWINVLFEQAGSPYSKFLNEWAVLGKTPKLFEYDLVWNTNNEPTNQLKLHFGGTDTTSVNDGVKVWFDAVYVTEEDAGVRPVPENNIILNSEMDRGDSSWAGWINTGSVTVATSIDTNAVLSGKNSYRLDITNGGNVTYYIQRNIPCPIQAGYTYKVNFLAVASREDVWINVLFEQSGDPYTKYLNEWAVLGTEPQLFEYTLEGNQVTEPTNELKLHFGGTDTTSVNDSVTVWFDAVYVIEELAPTSVSRTNKNAPKDFTLEQNYPNPFNPTTNIRFSLKKASEVKLVLYNVLGEVVQELVNGKYEAGNYTYSLDATHLSSGVYFYKLEAIGFSSVRKALLVK